MGEIIQLFGKQINIRENKCSQVKNRLDKTPMKLNLYISITDICNANCLFCNNNTKKNSNNSSFVKFDCNKLKTVLIELKKQDILNRVAITGGEPFLNIKLLDCVLTTIFEVCGDNQDVTINTNGTNLKQCLQLKNLNKITGIHISRHHYLDEVNDQIFGTKVAHVEDIKYVMDHVENKKLLRLNCLLIKGQIDSTEQVMNFLDFAANINIFRVGFVSLMPINSFSKQHFVDYVEVMKNLPESCLKFPLLYNNQICDCTNGIYISKNMKMVEYYARCVRDLNPSEVSQFNYSADNHLKAGFNNVIY